MFKFLRRVASKLPFLQYLVKDIETDADLPQAAELGLFPASAAPGQEPIAPPAPMSGPSPMLPDPGGDIPQPHGLTLETPVEPSPGQPAPAKAETNRDPSAPPPVPEAEAVEDKKPGVDDLGQLFDLEPETQCKSFALVANAPEIPLSEIAAEAAILEMGVAKYAFNQNALTGASKQEPEAPGDVKPQTSGIRRSRPGTAGGNRAR